MNQGIKGKNRIINKKSYIDVTLTNTAVFIATRLKKFMPFYIKLIHMYTKNVKTRPR